MLKEVDTSKDRAKMVEKAMQIPIFTEFVDECLRVVEPQQQSTSLSISNNDLSLSL